MQRPPSRRCVRCRRGASPNRGPDISSHDAAVDTGQSCSRWCAGRNDRDTGWRHVALCALGGAGQAEGALSASSPGAASTSRNISKRCGICASAVMRWPSSTGAGRGIPRASYAIRSRAMSRVFRSTRSTWRPSSSRSCCRIVRRPILRWPILMGCAVLPRAAHAGLEVFERFCALRADDRPAASARIAADARPDAHAARGRNGRAVYSRRQHRLCSSQPASPAIPDLGSARRYARNVAILEADPTLGIASPTVAWLDAAFAAMAEFRSPEFAGADPPAGPDARGKRLTPSYRSLPLRRLPGICRRDRIA